MACNSPILHQPKEYAMYSISQTLRRISYTTFITAAIISGPVLAAETLQQETPEFNSLDYLNTDSAKIQLAILLDTSTSTSMDGLIDQTRNQLWQIVNQFSTAKKKQCHPSP
jgi:hypothetical protein